MALRGDAARWAEIAAELFLWPHTIKAQMRSIYRKLEATTRHQTVTRPVNWGSWRGKTGVFTPLGDETCFGAR